MTLKEIRERRGFTQAKVAEIIGVRTRTYRRWENGDQQIPSGRLLSLSKLFGLPIEELLRAWAELGYVDAPEVNTWRD